MARKVYFIRPIGLKGPIRIGGSHHPAELLKNVARWSPLPLEIVATAAGNHAARVCAMFSEQHMHGGWFKPNAGMERMISRLAAGSPLGDIIDLKSKFVPFARSRVRYTADYRRRVSYVHRLRWFSKKTGRRIPNDVREIIHRWAGSSSRPAVLPTEAEIARLELVLDGTRDAQARAICRRFTRRQRLGGSMR